MRLAQILSRPFIAYIFSDVTRTAILKWGPFGHWTPRCVRLPAEPARLHSAIHCVGKSHGDQHNAASLYAINPLMTNIRL